MADPDPRAIAAHLGISGKGLTDQELSARLLSALVERNDLLRRLSRIQRSIAHRAPLQEVLDAITAGAAELLRDEVVGLRLVDPDDDSMMHLWSVSGLDDAIAQQLERTPVGSGAGGRAYEEDRLVIVGDYQSDPSALSVLVEHGLAAAMAAPVYEHGKPAGSLVVASYSKGRTYSPMEQEMLLAFAEHASLALTDARTVERLREAQHAKDMFFAMASHELKTPLTVIMGTLRTIEKHQTALAGKIREEMLASAYARGQELKDLIDRLLQGARAELAGMTKTVFLPELVERAVRGFDDSRLHVGPIPEVHLEIDDLAVYEVLGVFLENAFAHSPAGSPIELSAVSDDDETELTVSNRGELPEGIVPADLFQPFRRGPDEATKGVGLGLYIAARMADAIGGKVTASGTDGRVSFALGFSTTPSEAPSVQS